MAGSFSLPSTQIVRFARVGVLVAATLLPGLALAADLIGTAMQGNKPAPGVTVSLGDIGAVSDSTGRFVIRNIRPGDYVLKCGKAAPLNVKINDGLNQVSCQAQ